MARIAACFATRDNNLNLLRVLSAGAVIVSHARVTRGVRKLFEPLREDMSIFPKIVK